MDWILTKIRVLIALALSFLPDSPFSFLEAKAEFSEWFGILNWIVPISSFVAILQVWLPAVAIFYVIQVFLRWGKIIEG